MYTFLWNLPGRKNIIYTSTASAASDKYHIWPCLSTVDSSNVLTWLVKKKEGVQNENDMRRLDFLQCPPTAKSIFVLLLAQFFSSDLVLV